MSYKTPMQLRFGTSKILRQRAYLLIQREHFPARGSKRLFRGIFKEIYSEINEAEIKRFLFQCLQCNITQEQRQEIIDILNLSQTALTKTQQKQLKSILLK